MVSIPLKSGRFVINLENIISRDNKGFNPLKIGSVCNTDFQAQNEINKIVSIPLKSGRFVIKCIP